MSAPLAYQLEHVAGDPDTGGRQACRRCGLVLNSSGGAYEVVLGEPGDLVWPTGPVYAAGSVWAAGPFLHVPVMECGPEGRA